MIITHLISKNEKKRRKKNTRNNFWQKKKFLKISSPKFNPFEGGLFLLNFNLKATLILYAYTHKNSFLLFHRNFSSEIDISNETILLLPVSGSLILFSNLSFSRLPFSFLSFTKRKRNSIILFFFFLKKRVTKLALVKVDDNLIRAGRAELWSRMEWFMRKAPYCLLFCLVWTHWYIYLFWE